VLDYMRRCHLPAKLTPHDLVRPLPICFSKSFAGITHVLDWLITTAQCTAWPKAQALHCSFRILCSKFRKTRPTVTSVVKGRCLDMECGHGAHLHMEPGFWRWLPLLRLDGASCISNEKILNTKVIPLAGGTEALRHAPGHGSRILAGAGAAPGTALPSAGSGRQGCWQPPRHLPLAHHLHGARRQGRQGFTLYPKP